MFRECMKTETIWVDNLFLLRELILFNNADCNRVNEIRPGIR